jgi:hypothetical protein
MGYQQSKIFALFARKPLAEEIERDNEHADHHEAEVKTNN